MASAVCKASTSRLYLVADAPAPIDFHRSNGIGVSSIGRLTTPDDRLSLFVAQIRAARVHCPSTPYDKSGKHIPFVQKHQSILRPEVG